MSHIVSTFVEEKKKTHPDEDKSFLLACIWEKNELCSLFWLPVLVTIFLFEGKASFWSPGLPEPGIFLSIDYEGFNDVASLEWLPSMS